MLKLYNTNTEIIISYHSSSSSLTNAIRKVFLSKYV